MMLEIFDGAIQNPNFINGIPQIVSNGFDKKTIDMGDINTMVEIAKQELGKNTDYLSLQNQMLQGPSLNYVSIQQGYFPAMKSATELYAPISFWP